MKCNLTDSWIDFQVDKQPPDEVELTPQEKVIKFKGSVYVGNYSASLSNHVASSAVA